MAQAIVHRYNGPQYQSYAVSIGGWCGYYHNGNTVWQDDEGYEWDEYKDIVDKGEAVLDMNDVGALDIRDEIERRRAVLIDNNK